MNNKAFLQKFFLLVLLGHQAKVGLNEQQGVSLEISSFSRMGHQAKVGLNEQQGVPLKISSFSSFGSLGQGWT